MANPQTCPSGEVLLDFAAGQLADSVRREIGDHLSTCGKCTEAVESIRSNLPGDIKGGLTGGSTTSGGPTVPECREPETEVWENLDDDRFDCAVLGPSPRQGALGRLGEYDILERVGHGGMGVVFKAFDERLQRTVAIKVMNRQLASSPTARRRFLREARAAAGISHPNVVTIHAVEEHGGYPVLVMEYIGGGTLREHIDEHGPLEPLEVIRLGKEIASGLAAAHAHGVIHRDIKPANILLEGGAVRVIITDFGLARAAIDNVDLTSQGHAVGTPAYMSPEQVKGESLDLQSDLFSLGCVIYAMVSGHSPFRGTSSLQMARNVAELHPPSLLKVCEETPQALSELVDRLLEKNPHERCQSASEVAQALGRYLEVLNLTPTDKMPATLQGLGLGKGVARRWLSWKVATTMIVLVAVAVSVFMWRPWDRNGNDSGNERPRGVHPLGPSLITVGPSGEADAQSLGEALERAGRDTVIRLDDGQRFIDNIVISERHQGIHLEADVGPRAERPTLAASDDSAPVIQINGVSNVVIRGLRIEGSVRGGIAIEGECGGVEIENVECLMPDVETADTLRPGVAIRASRPPGESKPVIVRNSRIETPALGRCVQLEGTNGGSPDVRLEDNRFSGRGVLVLVGAKTGRSLGNVVIAGNLFVGRADRYQEESGDWHTTNGVNLVLETLSPDQVLINNNTFVNVRTWMGLVDSATDRPGVTVVNNLILRSQGVRGASDRLPAAAKNWHFEGNWWEPALTIEEPRELQAKFATIHDRIEVLNRDDPEHPDFALPPPGSPLFSGGHDKDGLPQFVGARGPSDPGRLGSAGQ